MPDPNKFRKLREIGYTIPKLCMFCEHSSFGEKTDWGTCKLHRYQHEKHDNPTKGRGVSIHRGGQCSQFKLFVNYMAPLGAHQEFFDV